MNKFVQFHFLTFYPPSNPNRDDLGRPKTAIVGGEHRMRISSQSLKRSWRVSDVFSEALGVNKGIRTKKHGSHIFKALTEKGIKEKDALTWSLQIINVFGKPEGTKATTEADLKLKQIAYFSPEEIAAIDELVSVLAEENREPKKEELNLLRKENSAADLALFGRMLASDPDFNVDASMQVAHAFTVNKVDVEEDFFTAVDDLNDRSEDAGSAHMGVSEFSSGLFYLYVCLDKEALLKNLNGNKDLMQKALKALTEAMATVGPDGKQNSFANRVQPSYILCEKGNKQPRSLAVSFVESLDHGNLVKQAIEKMTEVRENMDKVYGKCAETDYVLNASAGEGTLIELADFVAED